MSADKIIVHIDVDLEEIVPGFLQNKKKDIITMQNAILSQDFETIEVLGHRMKGAGGGYGFDEISRIGADIEKAASQKKQEKIQLLLQELEQYLSCVEVIYE